jgi:hypothetical protein
MFNHLSRNSVRQYRLTEELIRLLPSTRLWGDCQHRSGGRSDVAAGCERNLDVSSANLPEGRVAFQRQPMKWQGIVENLGEEFSCPIFEVGRMLSAAAHQLELGAQIKEFVSVLAVKEVKGLLRAYRSTPLRHEQRDLNHPQSSQPSPRP